MSKPLPCELVTWGQVERLTSRLVEKIRQAAYQPDVVIAIARGGYVPARLLCDQMDIFDLTSIRIIHYESGIKKMAVARLSMGLGIDVQDLKVLVVDDVTDTGESLQLAVSHIERFKPAEMKLAVLHHKNISVVKPDFYGQKIVKWRWLTYPWAVYEDVSQFIAALKPRPGSVAEAAQRLHEAHGIKVPKSILKKIKRVGDQ